MLRINPLKIFCMPTKSTCPKLSDDKIRIVEVLTKHGLPAPQLRDTYDVYWKKIADGLTALSERSNNLQSCPDNQKQTADKRSKPESFDDGLPVRFGTASELSKQVESLGERQVRSDVSPNQSDAKSCD